MDDAPSLPSAEDIFTQPVASFSSSPFPKGTTFDVHSFTKHLGGKRDYHEQNWGIGITIPFSSRWSVSTGWYQNSFTNMPAEQKRHANGRTNTPYLLFNFRKEATFKAFSSPMKYGISFGFVDYYGEQTRFEVFDTENKYLNTVSAAVQLSATFQITNRINLRAGLVPLGIIADINHHVFGVDRPQHASNIASISAQFRID